jgi:hypothetical protein
VTNAPPIISLDDQRLRIEQLSLLVAERLRAEAGIRASYESREATLNEQLGAERQRVLTRQQSERATLQSQHASELSRVVREYELAIEAAVANHERESRRILVDSEQAISRASADWDVAQERLRSEYAATVQSLQQALREFKDRVEEPRKELRELEEQAWQVVRRRRCRRAAENDEPRQGICNPNAPLDSYAVDVAQAKVSLDQFRHQWAPKFLASGALVGILMVLWIAIVGLGLMLLPSQEVTKLALVSWLVAGGAISGGIVAIVYVLLRPVVVRETLETFDQFRESLANADIALDAAVKIRAAEADTKKIDAQRKCDQSLRVATVNHQKHIEELMAQREVRLRDVGETLQTQRKLASENRTGQQREVNQRFSQESQRLQELHAEQTRQMEEREQSEASASSEMHRRAWQRLVTRWREGLQEFVAAVDKMWDYCNRRFPPWDSMDWESTFVVDDTLPALPFGKFSFSLRSVPGGVPDHPDLVPDRVDFDLPAVLSFATRPSLLFEAWGDGRAVAARSMQNVMLRLLTALPPGKVRFTIVDPVGLGQNFSAFMHLADFDEKLVTHRIWTESQHIQQRLADLTEHMENVIQTYLRNEFATIDEYNQQAGEVAEPFHVLVVANFPAGFSDEAVQRLLSIMHSGSRCGVYSIISTDSKLDLPRNCDLSDLESHATTVQWDGQRFRWRDESLKDLPLTLAEPPDDERLTQAIRVIGRKAKDAIRIEVPFATVACPSERWWTQDSRGGIDVALGRAGASKLQYLRLGKGTSQHVLISGKTGSGKSTLLHALITNAAIHYSPWEIEFYLIDFKKGVELNPYASI